MPSFITDFKALFEATKPSIANFKGCLAVQLFQQEDEPGTFFTISQWESAVHLANYRNSELFISTWKRVKPNFASKAEAWSLVGAF